VRGGVTPPYSSFESNDGMNRKPSTARKMDSPGQNQAGLAAQHYVQAHQIFFSPEGKWQKPGPLDPAG